MSGKHAVKSSKKSLIIIICVVVLVAVIAGAVILFLNLSGKNNNSATTVPTVAASTTADNTQHRMFPTLYPKPHSMQPNRVKLHKSRQNRDTQPKHLQMTVKLLFRQSAERSKSQNSVQLLFRTMQKTKILLKNIL